MDTPPNHLIWTIDNHHQWFIGNFKVPLETRQEQMKKFANVHRRDVVFDIGDGFI